MRSRLLFAALCLAAVLPLIRPVVCRADQKDDETRLQALLAERRDALRKTLEANKQLVAAGQASADSLVTVAEKLVKVELELAEKPADRIALREEFVKIAKEAEKVADARLKTGTGSVVEYGRVKDLRLEAEIELLREQLKAKKAAK